jgi:hypothetical protein
MMNQTPQNSSEKCLTLNCRIILNIRCSRLFRRTILNIYSAEKYGTTYCILPGPEFLTIIICVRVTHDNNELDFLTWHFVVGDISGLYYKTITIVIMTIVSDATIWSVSYNRN